MPKKSSIALFIAATSALTISSSVLIVGGNITASGSGASKTKLCHPGHCLLIMLDLVTALQADGPFTVFAPTDAAFAAAGIDLASYERILVDSGAAVKDVPHVFDEDLQKMLKALPPSKRPQRRKPPRQRLLGWHLSFGF